LKDIFEDVWRKVGVLSKKKGKGLCGPKAGMFIRVDWGMLGPTSK
jgi:hypothetical protein